MKEQEEIEFTTIELREYTRNRVHKAFLQKLKERIEELQYDLGLPSQTKTLDIVRAMQGALSENKGIIDWFEALERNLELEQKE